MDILSYKTVNEGVWFDVPGGNAKVKVARINHPDYKKKLAEIDTNKNITKMAKAVGTKDEDLPSVDEVYNAMRVAAAETLLLDWKGFTEGKKELPYSKEKALELMTDSQYDQFADMIINFAQQTEMFLASKEEQTKKN